MKGVFFFHATFTVFWLNVVFIAVYSGEHCGPWASGLNRYMLDHHHIVFFFVSSLKIFWENKQCDSLVLIPQKWNDTRKFAINIQNLEQHGFTINLWVQKMQTEWQTVYTLISLICPDLPVKIFRRIMVVPTQMTEAPPWNLTRGGLNQFYAHATLAISSALVHTHTSDLVHIKDF